MTSAEAGKLRLDIEYGRAAGASLRLDAFVPHGPGPFPAAIVIHGGAWVAGDRRLNVEPLFSPLAEAGFAWFSISYRLAKQMSSLGDAVEDVEQAIRYVRAHAPEFKADPGRIVLVGESAGGQLAALAALGRAGSAVTAVVSLYAPTDLEQAVRGANFIPEQFRQAVRGTFLESAVMEQLRNLSPIRRLHSAMPPFLLIHGTADALVPFEQSRNMCREIRKAGGQCDLLAVKGGGHGVRWWESAGLVSYRRLMIDWLRTRVGLPGAVPPPSHPHEAHGKEQESAPE
jgi:acetyl esterase